MVRKQMLEALMASYEPQSQYQALLLARHHLSSAPIGDRQRTAIAQVGEHADELLDEFRPPAPR